LYGAEVVSWTSSELSRLSRMNYAYNSALRRLYKIRFNSLAYTQICVVSNLKLNYGLVHL